MGSIPPGSGQLSCKVWSASQSAALQPEWNGTHLTEKWGLGSLKDTTGYEVVERGGRKEQSEHKGLDELGDGAARLTVRMPHTEANEKRRPRLRKEKGDWNHKHAYKQALKLHSYSHPPEF